MISIEQTRAAVEQLWAAGMGDVPTAFAGAPLAAEELPRWCELWVTRDRMTPRRGVERADVTVSVHVFVREEANARAAEALADRAVAALERRGVATTAGGCVRLREAELRDLTRDRAEDGGPLLRHLVLTVPGMAEGGRLSP